MSYRAIQHVDSGMTIRNHTARIPLIKLDQPVSRKHFDFKLPRFWSSPEHVPGITIIAHVLCTPAQKDIEQVINYFGLVSVLHVLDLLEDRKEISSTARKFATRWIVNKDEQR